MIALLIWVTWTPMSEKSRDKMGAIFQTTFFKWIFLNGNVCISINISLKFVPRGPINNTSALVQIMARHRPGDKPLSEPMMVRLPTHICVTRPQWVKLNHSLIQVALHRDNPWHGASSITIHVSWIQPVLGLVSQLLARNWIFAKNPYYCYSTIVHQIATKVCTWQGSTAVVD